MSTIIFSRELNLKVKYLKDMIRFLSVIFICMSLFSCSKEKDKDIPKNVIVQKVNDYNDIIILKKKGNIILKHELFLTFNIDGFLNYINFQTNGPFDSGDLLASLSIRVEEFKKHDILNKIENINKLIEKEKSLKSPNTFKIKSMEKSLDKYNATLVQINDILLNKTIKTHSAGKILEIYKGRYTHLNKFDAIAKAWFAIPRNVLRVKMSNNEFENIKHSKEFLITCDKYKYIGFIADRSEIIDSNLDIQFSYNYNNLKKDTKCYVEIPNFIKSNKENLFIIPRGAIGYDNGRYYVYVVRNDKAIITYIDLVSSTRFMSIVTGDIKDDLIISKGINYIYNNQLVKIVKII